MKSKIKAMLTVTANLFIHKPVTGICNAGAYVANTLDHEVRNTRRIERYRAKTLKRLTKAEKAAVGSLIDPASEFAQDAIGSTVEVVSTEYEAVEPKCTAYLSEVRKANRAARKEEKAELKALHKEEKTAAKRQKKLQKTAQKVLAQEEKAELKAAKEALKEGSTLSFRAAKLMKKATPVEA